MATLIRLKQIESGSSLQQAAEVGNDFSQSVINIIQDNVAGTLPEGVVSSSIQVNLNDASGYDAFVVQLDTSMSSDLERHVVSSSLAQTIGILSQTYVTTASLNDLSSSLALQDSQSAFTIVQLSASVQATSGEFSASVAQQFSASSTTFNQFSSSLNDIYATDYEVYITSSQIIDQGEF